MLTCLIVAIALIAYNVRLTCLDFYLCCLFILISSLSIDKGYLERVLFCLCMIYLRHCHYEK
jgi:hypothetical protein